MCPSRITKGHLFIYFFAKMMQDPHQRPWCQCRSSQFRLWIESFLISISQKELVLVTFTRRWHVGFLSKQELYFVKDNYEIFSTEVFARENHGQNMGEPHQGVIGSLWISSIVRPFWICSPVGEFLSLNVPCTSLSIIQFLFLPSSCEVFLRKQLPKTPCKCRTSWVYD